MSTHTLPRPFGAYVLTAALSEDALGRQFRALRTGPQATFARVRILESPELSSDALLDAIEENGEVHAFLKNAAVARGVDMDAVDGVPYIAWSEPSGRTLADLLHKCRAMARRVPVEHALLIAEKVATALDHAYNTTIEGDRTLHGLVWPGFVAISDDGEIRLAGFGLAPGVLPSIGKPHLAREIGPYVAPEARESGAPGRNTRRVLGRRPALRDADRPNARRRRSGVAQGRRLRASPDRAGARRGAAHDPGAAGEPLPVGRRSAA